MLLETIPPGEQDAEAIHNLTTHRTTLHALSAIFRGAGTVYLQMHNTTGTPTTATLIGGFGFEMNPSDKRRLDVDFFGKPFVFTVGMTFAVSSTEFTYTASAQTCNVTPQWGAGS